MIDPRLVRVASDPVQLLTLTLLNELSTGGAGEIAQRLEISASEASRHLEALRETGLAEVVGEEHESGAAEVRYRALKRVLWEEEEWALFSLDEQDRLAHWIIEMIHSNASEAVDAGTFNARQSSHASRSIPLVDEQGWEELCRIHEDALEAILAVEAASAERLAERGEAGFQALSAMLCCELPPRRSGRPAPD